MWYLFMQPKQYLEAGNGKEDRNGKWEMGNEMENGNYECQVERSRDLFVPGSKILL